MIILGGIALIVFCLGLGIVWPHRHAHEIEISIWGYIAKSLFLSWVIFLISFFTPAGKLAPVIVPILAVCVFGLLWRRKATALSPIFVSEQQTTFCQILFALALVALVAKVIVNHDPIFALWDAVVSWNRWAAELYDNAYHPINAAYPFLWPAIWSLIYETQQSAEIWYFAKLSVAIPVLGLVLLAAGQIRTASVTSGVFLCGMIYAILFSKTEYLTSGYMDLTVAVIGLILLLLLIRIVEEHDIPRRNELVVFSTLTLSVALVTKQSAMLFLFAFLFVIAPTLYRRQMAGAHVLGMMFILLFPIATYLVIYSIYGTSVFGHLSMLESFVEDSRGSLSVYSHGWNLLAEIAPLPAALVMWLGVLLNLSNVKQRLGRLGLVFLCLAGIGFAIYANCCSYDWRTGVWLYAFLIASSYCGYKSVEGKVSVLSFRPPARRLVEFPPFLLPGIFCTALGILCVFQWVYPNEKLIATHDSLRERIVGVREWNVWFARFKSVFADHDRVVSFYQPFRYIPYTEKKYDQCDLINYTCIERQFSNSDVNSVVGFTFGAEDDDPAAKQFIESSMKYGVATLTVKENNNRLITYRRAKWADYVKTLSSD